MITVDRRELAEMIEHRSIVNEEGLASLIGVPVIVDTLDAADFAFLDRNNEPLGIERAVIGNLLQKLRSGELETQLDRCSEQYSHVILLTEGVYDHIGGYLAYYKKNIGDTVYFRTRIEPNTKWAEIKALQVRLAELGIEILDAPNFECSMKLIGIIYNQRTKPEEEHTLFRSVRTPHLPTKWSSNPSVPRLLNLCPRLGEKVAIKLIDKYNTIWNIVTTPDKDLLETKGFGRILVRRLKENIGAPDTL